MPLKTLARARMRKHIRTKMTGGRYPLLGRLPPAFARIQGTGGKFSMKSIINDNARFLAPIAKNAATHVYHQATTSPMVRNAVRDHAQKTLHSGVSAMTMRPPAQAAYVPAVQEVGGLPETAAGFLQNMPSCYPNCFAKNPGWTKKIYRDLKSAAHYPPRGSGGDYLHRVMGDIQDSLSREESRLSGLGRMYPSTNCFGGPSNRGHGGYHNDYGHNSRENPVPYYGRADLVRPTVAATKYPGGMNSRRFVEHYATPLGQADRGVGRTVPLPTVDYATPTQRVFGY